MVERSTQQPAHHPAARKVPTISIYQNPDHVSGILQQAHYAPLITSEQHDTGQSQTTSERTDRQLGGGLKASASLPVVGAIDADITGQRARDSDSGTAADKRLTRNFEYSQAYYLLSVRDALTIKNQLKTVKSAVEAKRLIPGDFVEFEATFRANEINALLDILTPDLIAAITYHQIRMKGVNLLDAYKDDYDALKVFAEKNMAEAQVKADLARSIAEAVRVDFRSTKTREYYGEIGAADAKVTAITICDVPHFVVDDEDRILDGNFTVLGKVASPVRVDLPILERNKVLDRMKPEGVDDLFGELRSGVAGQAQSVGGAARLPDDIFDLALASRIEGPSFNVIPVAIYI